MYRLLWLELSYERHELQTLSSRFVNDSRM